MKLRGRQEAPVSAGTVLRLMDVIDDPAAATGKVAAVVATDPGLTSRIFGLANSAAYGLARQVTAIDHAVGLVGTELVRVLALVGATSLLESSAGLPHARRHALEAACAAREIAPFAEVGGPDAFAAGLLHDVGELLLWQDHPREYARIRGTWTGGRAQLETEHALYGTDHALLGAEHLFEWRVPCVIVDAVGDHHDAASSVAALTLVVAAADEVVSGGPALATRILDLPQDVVEELADRAAAGADELEGALCR